MATGFTTEEIEQLEADYRAYMPPEPTLNDVKTAPRAKRLAFAGTEKGMLLHVDTGKHGKINLFLNPIVARTLMEGITQGGIIFAKGTETKGNRNERKPGRGRFTVSLSGLTFICSP